MDWTFFALWASQLGWPATFASIIIIAISAGVAINSMNHRQNYELGNPKYTELGDRALSAVNLAVATGVIWAIVMAIPEPDYKVETKVITKTVQVSALSEQEMYKTCMDKTIKNSATDIDDRMEVSKVCTVTALKLSEREVRK